LVRSALGVPAGTTFHRLRHAYASLLGDAGLPDHEIQRRYLAGCGFMAEIT
jgi:integrase